VLAAAYLAVTRYDETNVDVQVIPYLVVHVFPWWLAVDVLPGLGWGG
jgi:hypothetical protein